MTTLTADAYRRPLWAADDELFSRCLTGAGVFGLVLLAVILITPVRRMMIQNVDQLPPRFAKLILDKPKPVKLPAAEKVRRLDPVPSGGVAAPKPEAAPSPAPAMPRRLDAVRPLAPGAGQAGRDRAEKVVSASLAGATASLDQSLDGLSAALGSDVGDSPGPRRRARGVRGGRGEGQLASVSTGLGSGGGGADLGGSVVGGSRVAIGALGGGGGTGLGTGGGGGGSGVAGGSVGGTGSAPGVYRSNASLLAVIQKYAAGIQYCYGNELKRDPTLSGKLVVAMTVAASGEVIEAKVVQNTVGSERLASCALSQIRDWRFPAIAEGVTSFQAPFVFTPPN